MLNNYRIPFDTTLCLDYDSLIIISDYEFGIILPPLEAKKGTKILSENSNRSIIFSFLATF